MKSFLHDIWKMENGLPHNSIITIAQSPRGYLWLGTRAGLVRFDGSGFSTYHRQNTPVFLSNIVRKLLVDSKGRLWIGFQEGGLARYENGQFRVYSKENGLSSNNVWDIAESADGTIWIGTQKGLNRFKDGKLEAIPTDTIAPLWILSLHQHSSGVLWIGTSNRGLMQLKMDSRSRELKAVHVGIKDYHISDLLEDRDGTLWISTWKHGLFRWNSSTGIVPVTEPILPNKNLFSLCRDREGNMWIGSFGGGLYRVNHRNEVSVFDSSGGLGTNDVFSLYEDLEGSLWIGTESGGLNRLRDTDIITYTSKDGLSHDIIYGVLQDSRGDVWIGTSGFGVNRFRNGNVDTFTTSHGLSNNAVIAICEDKDSNLWFGTYGGGVNRFDPDTETFRAFTTSEGILDNHVMVVFADSNNTLWAGSEKGGIYRFSANHKRFEPVYRLKYCISSIFEYQNRLYIGTFGGGLIVRQNRNSTKNSTGQNDSPGLEHLNKENGFPCNMITTLYRDRDGVLWVGTLDGLIRYEPGAKKNSKQEKTGYTAVVINRSHGLPDNTVYSIRDDLMGHLWVGSSRGISRLDRTGLETFLAGKAGRISAVTIGKEYGLRSNQFTSCQPAGWRTTDGKLWFASTRGAAVIDPNNIRLASASCPVVIEKVSIDGTDYRPDQLAVVPPGKGHLEFHYTGLSFLAPNEVLFRYKLEGYDETWEEAGKRRSAYYTNIPPGKYKFRVMARMGNGDWSSTEPGAVFGFRYKPRRNKKWWLFWNLFN